MLLVARLFSIHTVYYLTVIKSKLLISLMSSQLTAHEIHAPVLVLSDLYLQYQVAADFSLQKLYSFFFPRRSPSSQSFQYLLSP